MLSASLEICVAARMGAEMGDLVSVIVPVYDSENYLKDCVDSIVNQTYRNLEIILVDDGSTDASGDICDKYARQDGRVHVIHKENGGNGDARNAGLRIARGQWIAMSDNDDILHKRQIETLLAVAHDKDADIAVGSYRSFDVHEVPVDEEIEGSFLDKAEVLSNRHLYDDKFIQKRSLILTVPWSKVCRKEVYNGVWYPAKSKHDDTWTTWRLYENAKRTAFLPIVLHYWRDNPNSFGRSTFDTAHFEEMDAFRVQMEYFRSKGKQRHVEITFALFLETFFWCYNLMKESGMDIVLLRPYWEYMKKNIRHIKLTKSLGMKQWLRYRYLAWYKIPRLILH